MYRYFRQYPSTLIIVSIILALGFFVKFLYEVTSYILIAGLLAYICIPVVTFFTKRKIHRKVVINIVFILVVALFILFFSLLIPKLVTQIIQFVKEIPNIYDSIVHMVDKNNIKILDKFDLESYLLQFRSSILQVTSSMLSLLLNFVTQKAQGFGFSLIFIPLLFYYFLRDYERFPGIIDLIFPASRVPQVKEFFAEYNKSLSSYFRGQVIIAVMVAVASWITLSILNIDFAVIIAVFGGVLNFIPVLGPLIASVPAILLALIKSPITAILVGVILFFINQVTSVIIFPNLISKQVKLSPIIIIIAVLAAGNLVGIVGILLVLPLIIMSKLFWIRFVRPELDKM